MKNRTVPVFPLFSDEDWEQVACALCGSKGGDRFVAAPNWDPGSDPTVQYSLVRCRSCDLCFLNPRPRAEKLLAFYPEQYYAYRPTTPPSHQGLKAFGQRVEEWTKIGLRRAFWGYPCPGGLIQRLALRIFLCPLWLRMRLLGKDTKVIPYRGRGRFLEVGCGTGGELAYNRRHGLTVFGVELSASAARSAREQYGLDVRVGTLEAAGLPDRCVDIIYMSHVFEHLLNPAASLEEMRRILDTDGLAILKVPNIASVTARRFGPYWLGLDLPRHLYHFSPETITQLLKRHGFAVEAIRHDIGSWSFWRESHRFQARHTQGKELKDSRWRNWLYQAAEAFACWRKQGSVIVVYARNAIGASEKPGPEKPGPG